MNIYWVLAVCLADARCWGHSRNRGLTPWGVWSWLGKDWGMDRRADVEGQVCVGGVERESGEGQDWTQP